MMYHYRGRAVTCRSSDGDVPRCVKLLSNYLQAKDVPMEVSTYVP